MTIIKSADTSTEQHSSGERRSKSDLQNQQVNQQVTHALNPTPPGRFWKFQAWGGG